MKILITLAQVVLIGASVFAEGAVKHKSKRPDGMSARDYIVTKRYGGEVWKPESGYGQILILNSQSKVKTADFAKAEKTIGRILKVATKTSDKPEKAQITVEVVEKDGAPTLAVYPDESRATVNVVALAKDGPDAAKLAVRTRKEIMRAVVYLVGGASSSVCVGELMDATTDLERLDGVKEVMPGDIDIRSSQYLTRLGIKPYVRMTYMQACQEGWAAQPTNEFQKAIWDKVHTLPTKPIKIEFDPKTDK